MTAEERRSRPSARRSPPRCASCWTARGVASTPRHGRARSRTAIWIEFEGGGDVDARRAAAAARPVDRRAAGRRRRLHPVDRLRRASPASTTSTRPATPAPRRSSRAVCGPARRRRRRARRLAARRRPASRAARPGPAQRAADRRPAALPARAVPQHGEEHDGGQVAREPLWWPPAKIATRDLAPYLAERLLRQLA